MISAKSLAGRKCSNSIGEIQEHPLQKGKKDEIRNKGLPLRNPLIKFK